MYLAQRLAIFCTESFPGLLEMVHAFQVFLARSRQSWKTLLILDDCKVWGTGQTGGRYRTLEGSLTCQLWWPLFLACFL